MKKEDLKLHLNNEQERLNLSSYAKQVIDNPAYKQAIMQIECDLLNKLKKVSFKSIDEIQELKRELSVIDSFKTKLENVMGSGKLAESNIAKLKQRLAKIGIR